MSALLLEPKRLETEAGLAAAIATFRRYGCVAPLVGLGAYAGGYPARIREALADTFEAIAWLVGDDAFTELCMRYAAARRPASYNLNDAGAALPRHLVYDPLTRHYPFLPALALLEWKLATAFHAATLPSLEPSTLAEWSNDEWEQATVVLQPSVAAIVSRWPLLSLWKLRETPRSETKLELTARAECVLVYRRELVVRLETIPRAEACALRSLQRGRRLADALERAAIGGASEDAVAGWLARWQSLGLLADCRPDRGDLR